MVDEQYPLKYRRDFRRMGRFWSRIDAPDGNYDCCWRWKGDFFYSHTDKRWYPVIPWAGSWVRVDLLAYRLGQKGQDGSLVTGRIRPANVRRKCLQVDCVNWKHIEEYKAV